MEDAHKEGCEVRSSKQVQGEKGLRDAFKILANHKMETMTSPKKFKISDEPRDKQAAVTSKCLDLDTIEELRDSQEFQRVNIIGRCSQISPFEEIKRKGGSVLQK